jgi:hypothetical protein
MEPDGRLCWRPSRRTNAIPARHEPESTEAPTKRRERFVDHKLSTGRTGWIGLPPGSPLVAATPGSQTSPAAAVSVPAHRDRPAHANPALASRHFPAFARRQVNQHEDGFPTPPHEKPSLLPGR